MRSPGTFKRDVYEHIRKWVSTERTVANGFYVPVEEVTPVIASLAKGGWVDVSPSGIITDTGKKGSLYIVMGPSGSGKTTVARHLYLQLGIPEVVSHTTREPRSGEIHGGTYHYVTVDKFDEMFAAGEFVEYVQYGEQKYGLTRAECDAKTRHWDAIAVVEGNGAVQLKANYPCHVIQLLPPSMEELERRMRARGGTTDQQIAQRLDNVKAELGFMHLADLVVPPYYESIPEGMDLEARANLERASIGHNVKAIADFIAGLS